MNVITDLSVPDECYNRLERTWWML